MQPPEFRFYYFTGLYEQTVAFYRDLLGLPVHDAWDRGQLDRGTIFRSPNGRGLIEVEAGTGAPSLRGGFYIEVPDVDALYARLREAGAPIRQELGDTGYGHRNFKTVDPSGIEVSFFRRITQPREAIPAGEGRPTAAPRVVPMIHVPDVRAAAQWYQELGFAVEGTHEDDDEMDWALLTLGSTGIMLNEGGRPSLSHRREVDLYVHTDAVDALYERLKDRVEVVEGLHDTPYGMREFIIRDLNRFWITFGEAMPVEAGGL